MSDFLGYGMATPEFFIDWQGTNGSPAVGTINWLLGFNDTINTFRYTKPMLYKDTVCEYDANGMPIINTIAKRAGTPDPLIRDWVFVIDSQCPENFEKDGVVYNKITDLLDFMSTTYSKNSLYTREELNYFFPLSDI